MADKRRKWLAFSDLVFERTAGQKREAGDLVRFRLRDLGSPPNEVVDELEHLAARTLANWLWTPLSLAYRWVQSC